MICWAFVFIANIIDYNSGISTSRALGEKISSKKMRKTFAKVSDYYRVLTFALLFDAIGSFFYFYKVPIASILSSAAVIAIEARSVIENSRKKKTAAADIPNIIKQIVNCEKIEEAKKIIDLLKNK